MNVFDRLSADIENIEMRVSETAQLKKLMRLFFLGQIVGLPTLHSILNRFEIKSNNEQIKYKKLCKSLSNNKIHAIFEFVFERQVEEALKLLSNKDASNWSREIVTAVLDDSVFKQWLQSQDAYSAYEGCYKRSFSGQVGHAVYGFQVVTFGLSIEGLFYPLYFQSVKKKDETDKSGKPTIEVATQLVKKWGVFKERLSKKGIILPCINFSCDSGYSDVILSEICSVKGLNYISVPKKNHYFIIQDIKTRLDDWVKIVFIVQEQKHIEAQKRVKEAERVPFTYRFRAFYVSQNREVTLLAFRLNGSKKVSIIYTTDKNIKAKTLRRHWFQRTYIEQFFKLLKHYLKIQQTITTTKHEFEIKLLRFAFIALHLQGLVKFMRRKIRAFKNKGFGTLRYLMQADKDIINLLKQNI